MGENQLRGQAFGALVVCAAFAVAGGGDRLLPEMTQHLALARKCASAGRYPNASAHARVIAPDRALRIRVDCASCRPENQGLFRNALSGAISMWEGALGGRVFVVAESGPFDVWVRFQPDVCVDGAEVAGHATWTRGVLNPDTNPKVILTARVAIRTVRPDDKPMTFAQLRACAAHELGHVLGLQDSGNTVDVMGPMDFAHPVVAINSDEVANLLAARREAEAIRGSER